MEEQIKKLVSVCSWFASLQVVTLFVLLGGTAVLYKDFKEVRHLVESVASVAPQEIENWAEYIRPHNASIGDKSARIVIEEFTDFQCPFCRSFNSGIRNDLLSKYGDEVRIIFKHYPLAQIHPEARMAAVAAQCALREGKFMELKEVLFENSDLLSKEFVIEKGALLGLGVEYANCVINEESLSEVEQDIKDGMDAGVKGTPTFIINGKVMNGARSLSQFEAIIEELN